MNRIAFGVSESPPMRSLLKDSLIQVDWVKVSDLNGYEEKAMTASMEKPALLHFFPRISYNEMPEDWSIIRFYDELKANNAPHVAIPLRASRNDFDRIPKMEEAIDLFTFKVMAIKKELKMPILLKNMPYSSLPDEFKYMADPDWISALCKKSGAGLLLDIAHAKISAKSRHETIESYLSRLPLHRLEEIHISGIKLSAGKWVDAHDLVDQSDLDTLKAVLKLKQPKIVVMEYDEPIQSLDLIKREKLVNSVRSIQTVLEQASTIPAVPGTESLLLTAVR